jgi:hypothetical protein
MQAFARKITEGHRKNPVHQHSEEQKKAARRPLSE